MLALAMAALAVTFSHGCANANTQANAPRRELRRAVICLVNRERAVFGLPPLHQNRRLDRSAQGWNETMIRRDDFTHGRAWWLRFGAVGYDWQSVGENIATGFPTPQSVVDAWMASPDHCWNILNPEYRDIGVGVNDAPVLSAASGPATWTQDFGLRIGARPPSRDWGPANGCPYEDLDALAS